MKTGPAKNRIKLAALVLFLAGVGLSAGCQVQAGFSTGWQSGTREAALTTTAKPDGQILLFAWFADGDTEVSQTWYERPGGHVETSRYVSGPNGAQDNRRRDLSPQQAAAFLRDLTELPAARISTARYVLVVDMIGKPPGEMPRYYDRRHLPPVVADLFAATMAPLAPPPASDGSYYPPDGDWSELPPTGAAKHSRIPSSNS